MVSGSLKVSFISASALTKIVAAQNEVAVSNHRAVSGRNHRASYIFCLAVAFAVTIVVR